MREGGGRREVVRYVELVMEGRERGRGGEREVERVREQLEMSQKTNNELSQKYIAASEKVSGVCDLWFYCESVSSLRLTC